ncbi:hypothetical protein [Suttonella indologenes]|uniref:hypothetical protein n=1 Tax=Suttonella indologenes TaxID=13276 RepID=UPI001558DE6D|nr:hypothetical protein [Suttonella indologenes]
MAIVEINMLLMISGSMLVSLANFSILEISLSSSIGEIFFSPSYIALSALIRSSLSLGSLLA